MDAQEQQQQRGSKRKKKSDREIVNEVNDEYGLSGRDVVSRVTAARHAALHPGEPARKRGRPCALPVEVEADMVDQFRKLQGFCAKLSLQDVCQEARWYLNYRGFHDAFDGHVPSLHWAKGFMKRHHLRLLYQMISQLDELNRALIILYTILAMALIEAGIAIPREGGRVWDIDITRPERLASFDETHLSTGMVARLVVCDHASRARLEALVHSDSQHRTLVLGSFASSDSVIPCIIFKGKTIQREWVVGGPRVESHGRMHDMEFMCTPSGGMEGDYMQTYLQNCIVAVFQSATELFTANPIVVMMDGVQSHVSKLATLQWAADSGVILMLRPPNTTHITQNEDINTFAYLMGGRNEGAWGRSKQAWLAAHPGQKLNNSNLMAVLKAPVEAALSRERNAKGWEAVGIMPWSRCLLENEEVLRNTAMQEQWQRFSGNSELDDASDDDHDAEDNGDDEDDAMRGAAMDTSADNAEDAEAVAAVEADGAAAAAAAVETSGAAAAADGSGTAEPEASADAAAAAVVQRDGFVLPEYPALPRNKEGLLCKPTTRVLHHRMLTSAENLAYIRQYEEEQRVEAVKKAESKDKDAAKLLQRADECKAAMIKFGPAVNHDDKALTVAEVKLVLAVHFQVASKDRPQKKPECMAKLRQLITDDPTAWAAAVAAASAEHAVRAQSATKPTPAVVSAAGALCHMRT